MMLTKQSNHPQRGIHEAKNDRNKATSSLVLFGMGVILSAGMGIGIVQAQTAPPPSLGEDTKGKPAVQETASTETKVAAETEKEQDSEAQAESTGILGKAKITESRRDNGQVYLIELEHSIGSKQYIEETDSDGRIEATGDDLEETPNLSKWRLGSW